MLREITHLTTCVLQQTLQRALNGVDHRTSSSQLLYTFGSPLSRPRFSNNRQANALLLPPFSLSGGRLYESFTFEQRN